MYIHRCKYQGHVKLLLRASYRIGGTVKKFTIATVTRFSSPDLALLEDLLRQRRALSRQDRHSIDSQIFSLLFRNVSPGRRWRLQSKPIGVRGSMGDPVFDFRPYANSQALLRGH
jgi:hypothetical protein